MATFARLVASRGLSEEEKSDSRERLAGRIKLLHEVIRLGLRAAASEEEKQEGTSGLRAEPC
jgi:hypothetical protein